MEQVNITEPAILLCINRLYKSGMSDIQLYDVTRGVWAAHGKRRSRAELAFAIFHGKIIGTYQIRQWHRAGTTPYGSGRQIDLSVHAKDWEFTGNPAPAEILEKYINRLVAPFAGNPIRYVNA